MTRADGGPSGIAQSRSTSNWDACHAAHATRRPSTARDAQTTSDRCAPLGAATGRRANHGCGRHGSVEIANARRSRSVDRVATRLVLQTRSCCDSAQRLVPQHPSCRAADASTMLPVISDFGLSRQARHGAAPLTDCARSPRTMRRARCMAARTSGAVACNLLQRCHDDRGRAGPVEHRRQCHAACRRRRHQGVRAAAALNA